MDFDEPFKDLFCRHEMDMVADDELQFVDIESVGAKFDIGKQPLTACRFPMRRQTPWLY
jgi:hypothetical protein